MTDEPSVPEDEWGGSPPPFSLRNCLMLTALFGVVCGLLSVVVLPVLYEMEEQQRQKRKELIERARSQAGSEPVWKVALDAEEIGKNSQGHAELRNKLDGSVLIRIASGSFEMGREADRHDVELSAYHIGRDPVTAAQYASFLAATRGDPHAHCHPAEPKDKDHTPDGWQPGQHSDRPVVGVDWFDAYAYVAWAGLRLPTEAEWERAARGTDGRAHPWGAEVPDATRARFGRLEADAAPADVSAYPAGTGPAGTRQQAGNVWEWCYDYFDEGFYGRSPPADPIGPSTGINRVVRGGSYRAPADMLESTLRHWRSPLTRAPDLGFRVAR